MPLCTWGANSYGQLGLGHCDDAWTPQVVESIPFTKISGMAGGGGHSAIISDDGRIAVCGNNSKGQLGVEPSIKKVLTFTEINHPTLSSSPAATISCGWEHTLITTLTGHVYGMGCNGYGQLGFDGQLAASSKPIVISDLKDVVKTACGLRHSVGLSRDGKVFCWGEGRRGQLGRNLGEKWRPLAVDGISELFVDIAAGQHHTAALTRSGAVYVWGCNKYGQLGVDPTKLSFCNTPMLISSLPQIIAISSGWSHVIACSSDGQLFGWGRSNYGQLATAPTNKFKCDSCPDPVVINDFQCLVKNSKPLLDCGSEHNLAIEKFDSLLYSWGWNEHGMCGLGTNSEDVIRKPQMIKLPNDIGSGVDMIACGAGHSLAFIV